MKHHASRLRSMWNNPPKVTSDAANARQVQALWDGLEDPPPNSLLVNLATGFPSALLCVLAAGVLAGALAGASFTPGVAPPVVLAAPPVAPAPTRVNGGMTDRHAQLLLLEQQALLAAPDKR